MNRVCFAIVTAAMALLPEVSAAGPREDAAAAMARCATLTDNKAFLECHETAAARLRSALQPVETARPMPLPPKRNEGLLGGLFGGSRPASPQNYGAEQLPAPQRRANRLTARVSEVVFSTRRYFTIRLDNGQVWQQVDGDTNYAQFSKPVSRNVINITPGALGSYNLHIDDEPRGYKVRRVK